MINVTAATQALSRRGPDFQNIYTDGFVGLGHRRLSIIDTSEAGNQPMWDKANRFCIVYNGEIFNYKELRQELMGKGISFRSQSDTEVLLELYINEGKACLNKLNGFFSFCIYDKEEQSFFLARDRYGIKPLLYQHDEDKFLFASEMKAMLSYGIEKNIDYNSLHTFLQLNYIPAPDSIFTKVKNLMPGHFLKVKAGAITTNSYYQIPFDRKNINTTITYDQAKEQFKELLESAVQKRLVSDVPLGSFLSGGLDSSIIAGLASKHKTDLHTFSIGFKDEPYFDETKYANLVASHFNTDHTVFSLTNNDLYQHLHSILDYTDEPFADSSAIAVYILSKETRKHATVALSGDGADELLGGYNKHEAMLRMQNPGFSENLITSLGGLWKVMPQSRGNALFNKFRQLNRFASAMKLTPRERYWQLAGFAHEAAATSLLSPASLEHFQREKFAERKSELLKSISEESSMNEILLTDTQMVLPNDMLTKVDLMSMANSLEVRSPFLDFELVNFIFSLPEDYKINRNLRKRIAQDAFREMLPAKLYNRLKKGFEVPLLKWFRSEMKSMITDDLLSESFVKEQGIFDYPAIEELKTQLFSSNPGDIHARIWGLIVFQWWWKKNVGSGIRH